MQDHQTRSFLRADQCPSATNGERRSVRFPDRFLRKAMATVCSVTLVLQSSLALAAEVTTYSYDQARSGAYNVGRLTTVANTAATVEKDYDIQGNVIRQGWTVDSTAYEHTYTYAPHGEVLRRSFSDGELLPSATETYQYDEFGNLESIPGLVTNITRTATFEPLVTTYANGVTETRSYDPNRQWLLSITSSNSGGTIFTESYTRNTKGLITTVASNRANGNWTYGYDTAYRLISATNLDSSSYTQTFQYDAADNITYNSQVGSYTYPSPVAARPHAVTQAGSLTYAYDANGNLTSGGGRTITYDGEERPTVVTALGQTTSFVYGPEGKRLKKTSAGDTTLYLGADEEITPSGERIKHPYSDVRKVGTTINWMQRDHLSSVRLMTDATGAVISENHFRPYGERTDVQVSLTVPRESKGWIGERDDPETGLTYLNARYYDPVLARFVSPDWFDPKKIGVGTNRYAYGLNNPVLHKDPSGNWVGVDDVVTGPFDEIAVIGVLAIAAYLGNEWSQHTLDELGRVLSQRGGTRIGIPGSRDFPTKGPHVTVGKVHVGIRSRPGKVIEIAPWGKKDLNDSKAVKEALDRVEKELKDQKGIDKAIAQFGTRAETLQSGTQKEKAAAQKLNDLVKALKEKDYVIDKVKDKTTLELDKEHEKETSSKEKD